MLPSDVCHGNLQDDVVHLQYFGPNVACSATSSSCTSSLPSANSCAEVVSDATLSVVNSRRLSSIITRLLAIDARFKKRCQQIPVVGQTSSSSCKGDVSAPVEAPFFSLKDACSRLVEIVIVSNSNGSFEPFDKKSNEKALLSSKDETSKRSRRFSLERSDYFSPRKRRVLALSKAAVTMRNRVSSLPTASTGTAIALTCSHQYYRDLNQELTELRKLISSLQSKTSSVMSFVGPKMRQPFVDSQLNYRTVSCDPSRFPSPLRPLPPSTYTAARQLRSLYPLVPLSNRFPTSSYSTVTQYPTPLSSFSSPLRHQFASTLPSVVPQLNQFLNPVHHAADWPMSSNGQHQQSSMQASSHIPVRCMEKEGPSNVVSVSGSSTATTAGGMGYHSASRPVSQPPQQHHSFTEQQQTLFETQQQSQQQQLLAYPLPRSQPSFSFSQEQVQRPALGQTDSLPSCHPQLFPPSSSPESSRQSVHHHSFPSATLNKTNTPSLMHPQPLVQYTQTSPTSPPFLHRDAPS